MASGEDGGTKPDMKNCEYGEPVRNISGEELVENWGVQVELAVEVLAISIQPISRATKNLYTHTRPKPQEKSHSMSAKI